MKKFTLEQLENIIKDQFLIAHLKPPLEIGINAELAGSSIAKDKYLFSIYQREKDQSGVISHRFNAQTVEELKSKLKQSIKSKNI